MLNILKKCLQYKSYMEGRDKRQYEASGNWELEYFVSIKLFYR